MLDGHIAVGFATKPLAPKLKLGYLLFAATAIDFLCGIFLLTGIEGVDVAGAIYIPWSHGLFMAGVWSLLGFTLAFLLTRDARSSLITEFGIFIAGILVYLLRTRAQDGMGRRSFSMLILFIFLLAVPAAFPKLEVVPTLALILLLPLGNWVDRHHTLVPSKPSGLKTGADRENVVL